eukprot:8997039-Lingulodinium_polyedra.AAC.1
MLDTVSDTKTCSMKQTAPSKQQAIKQHSLDEVMRKDMVIQRRTRSAAVHNHFSVEQKHMITRMLMSHVEQKHMITRMLMSSSIAIVSVSTVSGIIATVTITSTVIVTDTNSQ